MSKLTKKQEEAMLLAVQAIKGLEMQKKDIDAQIKEKTDTVKTFMESKLLEEMAVGEYTVRYASMAASRFDTTAFKREHEELYTQYLKPSTSKRFSIE